MKTSVQSQAVESSVDLSAGRSRGSVSNASMPRKVSMFGHIFGSHMKRIGVLRTFAGGLPMYLCIPLLIVAHMTTAVALYQWILRPLLRTPRVRWADYVIIDRHRITELTWFDKFNCMFCGYANGLTTMLNQEMDHTAAAMLPTGSLKRPLLWLVAVLWMPVYLMAEVGVQIIYNTLVSRPLGMHRVSFAQAGQMLRDTRYAQGHDVLLRTWLRLNKSVMLRFAMGLEQIESSWCPLRHFERRRGVVYPEHHKKFFGPDELGRMVDVLSTTGTVSDRRPTW